MPQNGLASRPANQIIGLFKDCPVPGCDNPSCPRDKPLCSRCMAFVPQDLQKVMALWRATSNWTEYNAACDRARTTAAARFKKTTT